MPTGRLLCSRVLSPGTQGPSITTSQREGNQPSPNLRVPGHQPCPWLQRVIRSLPRVPTLIAQPAHNAAPQHIRASGHTQVSGHMTHVGRWTCGHTHRAASSPGPQSPLELRQVGLKGLEALPIAFRRPGRTHKVTSCHFLQQVGRAAPCCSQSVVQDQACLYFPRRKCISHAHMQMCARSHGHICKHTLTCTQTGANAAQWLLFTNSGSEGLPQGVASCILKVQRGLCACQGRDRHPCIASPVSLPQSLAARPHAPPWKRPHPGRAPQPTRPPAATEAHHHGVSAQVYFGKQRIEQRLRK